MKAGTGTSGQTWFEALGASLLLGVLVAAGAYCLILFWGWIAPHGVTKLGAAISAVVIGLGTAGAMFWLFLSSRISARDIRQSIKDFWHELGKEPF